jgi:hypothetical protein
VGPTCLMICPHEVCAVVLTAIGSQDLVTEGRAVAMETRCGHGRILCLSEHFQSTILNFALCFSTPVCLSANNNSRATKQIFKQLR